MKWTKGTVFSMGLNCQSLAARYVKMSHDGYFSGNLGAYRGEKKDGFQWLLVHHPGGYVIAKYPTLRECKDVAKKIVSLYDPSFMDRLVNEVGTEKDYADRDSLKVRIRQGMWA